MHDHAQREPEMVRRLRARRADHLRHGRLYRAAFVVAGFLTLGAGLALLVLPGPAFVVIPIGWPSCPWSSLGRSGCWRRPSCRPSRRA
jgi:hypothetical protein